MSGGFGSSDQNSAPLTAEERQRYTRSIQELLTQMMPNSTKTETDRYGNVKTVLNLPQYSTPANIDYTQFLVPRNNVTRATQ